MAHIGFIGLGHMGLPMAERLLRAGHEVIGFDLTASAMQALKMAGGRVAGNLREAALNQDIVMTMLQTGAQVKAVCCDKSGLFQTMLPGTVLIDCSTIDIETTRFLHEQAVSKKLSMLDAPVSGGVSGAEQGRLTFMVGGALPVFERVKSVLACMGKQVIYAGDAGSGMAAKICNNMILGVSMIATAEAFLVAEKLGLSALKLHEIVSQASGRTWVMEQYVPVPGILPNVPANQDYQPGFTSKMMLKDLSLAGDAAEYLGIHAGMTAFARALYDEAMSAIGDLDFSAIITFIQQQSNKS